MSRNKCPACGSKDTVKILYGEPTYEAYLESEQGKLKLGGCCFSDISPTKHCKTCGQDFGSNDIFSFLEKITLPVQQNLYYYVQLKYFLLS